MAVTSLKQFRDFTVLCYEKNVNNDLEFTLLYGYSQYREIYPY